MGTVRRGIGSLAGRVAAWSDDGGPWRAKDDPRPGTAARQRRSPVRFEDIDKFLAMLAVIERQVGPLHDFNDSNQIGDEYRFNVNEPEEFKSKRIESWIEEVSRGSSKGQSLLLSGAGRGSYDFRWFIDLSSDVTAVSISSMSQSDLAAQGLNHLERAVESHTTPMRRSRRVVIEPVRAPDAAQRKHDGELATRINRAGMLWGGLAGVLGGGVIQTVSKLLGW